jgi:hypothetical protein
MNVYVAMYNLTKVSCRHKLNSVERSIFRAIGSKDDNDNCYF